MHASTRTVKSREIWDQIQSNIFFVSKLFFPRVRDDSACGRAVKIYKILSTKYVCAVRSKWLDIYEITHATKEEISAFILDPSYREKNLFFLKVQGPQLPSNLCR